MKLNGWRRLMLHFWRVIERDFIPSLKVWPRSLLTNCVREARPQSRVAGRGEGKERQSWGGEVERRCVMQVQMQE